MRATILWIAALVFLVSSPAEAQKKDRQRASEVAVCDDLKSATSGLYGLCVAYCAAQDLSNVDLNDVKSVRKAAPDRGILRNYNRKKRPGDPDMPCLQPTTPPDDGGDGGTTDGGDDSGDGTGDLPPVGASCPCWSPEEIGAIDGNLPPVDGVQAVVDCTMLADPAGVPYKHQVVEGYDLGFVTVEGVAWASIATEASLEPYNGCFISTTEFGRNFEITAGEAEGCAQSIRNQCELLGNP